MLKKNREIFAVLFIFIIVASFVMLYFNFRSKDFARATSFVLYYYDPVTKEIVPVSKDIPLKEDNVSNVYTLVDLLKNPDSTKLFPLIDANCNLRAVKISGTLCTVDFTFQKGKPQLYSVSREAAAVYGLVNTLAGLKGISEIQILIDGKPSQYFYHYIEIDKPLVHFDSMLPKGKSVNLYFPTQDLNALVVESREIIDSDDPVVLGLELLKELFYGSMYGLPQLIPGDYLNNFSIKSGGIATVDFKEDILKNSVGAHEESLFISSIVDTLTELPDIASVQITVANNVIPSLFGSVDISAPLTRFIVNLNKYLIPYYVYNFNGNSFYVPFLVKYGKLSYGDLFSLLKTPNTYTTMLSQDAKLVSYNLNGDTLELVVNLGNISGDDLEILKRQIALSYTELPGVRKVKLTVGEESFILGR
jgi:spore germination protein GerM